MLPTDEKNPSDPGKRRRLWIAVVVAVVIVAAIAIASGAFGDFARGLHDGVSGQSRPDTSGPH